MEYENNSTIHKLLEKLLEPNFDVSEEQLNLLTNHLPDLCSDPEGSEELFNSWFKRFIETWKNSERTVSTQAILTASSITGIICTNEQAFLNCNFVGLLDEFLNIMRILPEIQVVPYVQLYYIRLMKHFLKHKSGLQWLIASNSWYDILTMTLKKTDESIFKEGCAFIVELLDKSKNDNEVFCKNVIKFLMTPLIHFSKKSSSGEHTLDMDKTYLWIRERLNILENISKEMFNRSCAEKDFKFLIIMRSVFKIEETIEELRNNCHLKHLHLQLDRLLLLVVFLKSAKEFEEHSTSDCDKAAQLDSLLTKIYDILLKTAISIQDYSAILDLIHESHQYFHQILNSQIGCKIEKEEFAGQILAFILFPIGKVYRLITGKGRRLPSGHDELREQCYSNFFRRLTPLTFTTLWKIRRHHNILDALASFNHIQICGRNYENTFIIVISLAIVYFFEDMLEFLEKSTETLPNRMEEYLSALLETLIYLFTEFDISWKDGIETTYIRDNTIRLLKMSDLGLSSKIITRALQLLNVAIRKNLSPELHLLLDDLPIENLPLIKHFFAAYLNHPSWEVRNAAVQVIHARVQTKKDYISTKVALVEMNYNEKILNMIISDSDVNVRISALRCFRYILSLDDMWERLSKTSDFYDKIMHIFYFEKDGVLRSEVIGLITIIYELQDLSNDIVEKFYDIMSYAVLQDDFWSVKTNALYFWKNVIDKYLKEEGMIDGEFPSVTFSKKLKKIVTFDDSAIKSCLERVLRKLNDIECLTVFMFALNCQLENIEETALHLIKPFMELLKKYYITTETLLSPRRDLSDERSFFSPKPGVGDSVYSNSSNLFSPYPESLYNDIIDMEEPLVSDPSIINDIFTESNLENPEEEQLKDFVKFVENFDFSSYNKTESNDIGVLLNSILG